MKTIVCVFKHPDTGKECAYKVTVDPKVYGFDWTDSEVRMISTGSRNIAVYDVKDWHKSIDVEVHNTCDDMGNLFTFKEKLTDR